MNIFVLHRDPEKAAGMLCDSHVVKMVVESAQMMASVLRRHGAGEKDMPKTVKGTPYKNSHPNHPCTLWAGDSGLNYQWLSRHALALCAEYTLRYGKTHACEEPIRQMCRSPFVPPEKGKQTPFAQVVPDEFRHRDVVKAYRAYYGSKDFARWERATPPPAWWS
ncbi:MAG: pyrimidine dimer DNA glycosylase/endonuclease V [Verrucomicrobiota bacterium]|nr:pyrimidine dimer DNA glycosylase/endonuclease V [Verrucomicrobiota bacterium]